MLPSSTTESYTSNADAFWRHFHRVAPGRDIPVPLQWVRELPDSYLAPYLDCTAELLPVMEHSRDLTPLQRFFRYEILYRKLLQRLDDQASTLDANGLQLHVPRARFNLNRLKTPQTFLTDPEDGIQSVTLTHLMLDSAYWNTRVTLSTEDAHAPMDYPLFTDVEGLNSAFIQVVGAVFSIEFKGGYVFDLRLMVPDRMATVVLDRFEKCLIWDKYLTHWGLLQPWTHG